MASTRMLAVTGLLLLELYLTVHINAYTTPTIADLSTDANTLTKSVVDISTPSAASLDAGVANYNLKAPFRLHRRLMEGPPAPLPPK